MSKTTLILFATAVAFYLLSWTGVASGLFILGVGCEVLMYISMHADSRKSSDDVDG